MLLKEIGNSFLIGVFSIIDVGIIILNKIDLLNDKKLAQIKKKIKPDLCISAQNDEDLTDLKELISSSTSFFINCASNSTSTGQ